jgi:hypothetical protein
MRFTPGLFRLSRVHLIPASPFRANGSHGRHPELEATVAEESATDEA